jgi:hypothetical protein
MSRASAISRRVPIAVVGLMALLLTAETIALAATFKRGGGSVNGVQTATANDVISLAENPSEDVLGMLTSITVPAQEDGLLVITFSAASYCAFDPTLPGSQGDCVVRVLVDGVAAQPGLVDFGEADSDSYDPTDTGPLETRSMQFVAGPLHPGTHQVKVQVLTSGPAVLVMTDRTLTVLRSRVRPTAR